MQLQDWELQVKRGYRKITSQKIAHMLREFVETNYPNENVFIRNMIRQLKCSSYLLVYDNQTIKSIFCNQKSCPICNSIRLAKFLDKFLPIMEEQKYLYHLVLTIRSPNKQNLKKQINRMYKFFDHSAIKKNKIYRRLNKKIIFIRSFETTFNKRMDTYHIHFHILLGGDNEEEVKTYGNLLIEYWLKYFKDSAESEAQYLEKQKKSALENFKYLFKFKDITKGTIPMTYEILKATRHKKLFTAKNIKREKISKALSDSIFDDTDDANISQRFHYDSKSKNWIDEATGEVLVTDEKLKRFKSKNIQERNYKKLHSFFQKKSRSS